MVFSAISLHHVEMSWTPIKTAAGPAFPWMRTSPFRKPPRTLGDPRHKARGAAKVFSGDKKKRGGFYQGRTVFYTYIYIGIDSIIYIDYRYHNLDGCMVR